MAMAINNHNAGRLDRSPLLRWSGLITNLLQEKFLAVLNIFHHQCPVNGNLMHPARAENYLSENRTDEMPEMLF